MRGTLTWDFYFPPKRASIVKKNRKQHTLAFCGYESVGGHPPVFTKRMGISSAAITEGTWLGPGGARGRRHGTQQTQTTAQRHVGGCVKHGIRY